MKGVILAAGRGSRLLSLTDDRPKGLVPVLGRPMIDWQIRAMRDAGIEEITIVAGYRSDEIRALGLPVVENPDWASTNMVWSLMAVRSLAAESPIVASYSDIVYGPKIVQAVAACAAPACVAYDPGWMDQWSERFDDVLEDAETFRLTDGMITEIGAKPTSVDEIQGQYMGLNKFEAGALDQIASTYAESFLRRVDMTGLLSELIAKDWCLRGVATDEPWCEVDHPDDIAVAERLLTRRGQGTTWSSG